MANGFDNSDTKQNVRDGSAADPLGPPEAGWRFLWHKCWLGVSVALLQIGLYMSIGRADVVRSTELLRLPIDDAIPFLPWTSFAYLPCYLGVFVLALVAIRRRRTFYLALVTMAIIGLVAAVAHWLVPAVYPRPILTAPYADLGEHFMAFVQRIDPPSNVFPSLHVAHSLALSLFLLRDRPRAGRWAMAMTIALTISTVTTKQHFVVDLAAGALLAWAAVRFVWWLGHTKLKGVATRRRLSTRAA